MKAKEELDESQKIRYMPRGLSYCWWYHDLNLEWFCWSKNTRNRGISKGLSSAVTDVRDGLEFWSSNEFGRYFSRFDSNPSIRECCSSLLSSNTDQLTCIFIFFSQYLTQPLCLPYLTISLWFPRSSLPHLQILAQATQKMQEAELCTSSTKQVHNVHTRNIPDVQEDVEFIMEHLNDPNFDLTQLPSSIPVIEETTERYVGEDSNGAMGFDE